MVVRNLCVCVCACVCVLVSIFTKNIHKIHPESKLKETTWSKKIVLRHSLKSDLKTFRYEGRLFDYWRLWKFKLV